MSAIALRKSRGVVYTPRYIVDHIVEQILGPSLEGKTPQQAEQIKILDPACGQGVFLIGAYEFLIAWHLNWYRMNDPARLKTGHNHQHCLSDEQTARIGACLYGVDIDPISAGKTIQALCALGAGNLEENIRFGNALIDSKKFSWTTAFPNVREAGGFDAILGNPPYVRIQNLSHSDARHFKTTYTSATGRYDLYPLFIERSLQLLNPTGRIGFILPNKFFTAQYGRGLRRLIQQQAALEAIVDFRDRQLFTGASTYTCLLFLKKQSTHFSFDEIAPQEEPTNFLARLRKGGSSANRRTRELSDIWNFTSGSESKSLSRLLGDGFIPLKELTDRIFQGVISGADRLLYLSREEAARWNIEPDLLHPILKGPDVGKYRLRNPTHFALFPYESTADGTHLIDEDILTLKYPNALKYLREKETQLRSRGSASMTYESWYAYWCPRDKRLLQQPKILTQVLARGSKFAFDCTGAHYFVGGGNAGVYGITLSQEAIANGWSYELLLGILNSRAIEFVVRRISSRFQGGYVSYARRFIERVPIWPVGALSVRDWPENRPFVNLVTKMVSLASITSDSDEYSALERRLNLMVLNLFALSEKEID